ncbi:MAG: hypothetical protein LBK02_00465 [Treponema sp.]|jgi:hypothetical protein|nr:hypothetical protein [Treponema sp.]
MKNITGRGSFKTEVLKEQPFENTYFAVCESKVRWRETARAGASDRRFAPAGFCKRSGIMIFLLVVNFAFVYAQETGRRYCLQIDPAMLVADIFMGTISQENYSYSLSAEFQYAINNYWNVIVRPNFFATNSLTELDRLIRFYNGAYKYNINNEIGGTNIIFTIMPGILFRPFGTGLKGMYIGLYPNIGWENKKYEYEDLNIVNINDNFLIAGVGIEAGYEWIFRNGFCITVGGGLERNWGIESEKNKGKYRDPKNLYNIRIIGFLGYSF